MYWPRSFGRKVLKEMNKANAEPYRRVKDMDVIYDRDGQTSLQNLMKLGYRGLNSIPLPKTKTSR